MKILVGRSDDEIGPAEIISPPFENTIVSDAGIGALSVGIKSKTLKPQSSMEMEDVAVMKFVVGAVDVKRIQEMLQSVDL